jgi:hypothetical protein
MSSPIITQLLSEKPVVVLVGEPGFFCDDWRRALELEKTLKVIVFSPSELNSANFFEQIAQAYRVMWLCQDDHCLSTLSGMVASLRPLGRRLVLVKPVMMAVGAVESESNHPPQGLLNWQKHSQFQHELIVNLNSLLPQAQFLFGQDLVGRGYDYSALSHLCAQIHDGILFDPNQPLPLLDGNVFISHSLRLLFRPKMLASLLVVGQPQDSSTILFELRSRYEQATGLRLTYHQGGVDLGSPTPFSVDRHELGPLSAEVLTDFVHNLIAEDRAGRTFITSDAAPASDLSSSASDLTTSDLTTPANAVSTEVEDEVEDKVDNEVAPTTFPEIKEAKPKTSSGEPFDLADEVSRIFTKKRAVQKVDRIQHLAKDQGVVIKKSRRKRVLFYGGITFMGVGLGLLFLSGVFLASEYWVKSVMGAVVSQTISQQEVDEKTWSRLALSSSVLELQSRSYQALTNHPRFDNSQSLVEISQSAISAKGELEQLEIGIKNLVLQLFGRETGDTPLLAQNTAFHGLKAYENLSRIQANIKQVSLSDDEAEQEALKAYEQTLLELRKSLTILQQLEPLVAGLSGVDEKRVYAVVLQNEQELRPTGGFIQAVALLNYQGGGLVSQQIYSSYELDSKLGGAVEPPDEVRRYLGEERWYLRDSNWDPHFPAAAERMVWFIEKSTGSNIDGLIALNLSVVEEMIAVLGPLELPEFNEVVTNRNLQERFEFRSEVVLVETDRDRDYSKLVLERLVHKMVLQPEEKIEASLAVLSKALSQQQLLFYLKKPQEQDTLLALGWAGALTQPACPSQLYSTECVVEVLAQVEANIGVNKANYYLKREQDHSVNISRGQATHTHTLTLENTAKSNSWPKGTYKAFVRYYLSGSPTLDEVVVNGRVLTIEDVHLRKEADFTLFGFVVEVPIQQRGEVKIVYSTPLPDKKSFTYAFFNQKQSGTKNSPLVVRFNHGEDLVPTVIAPQANVSDGVVSFSQLSEGHSFIGVKFE